VNEGSAVTMQKKDRMEEGNDDSAKVVEADSSEESSD